MQIDLSEGDVARIYQALVIEARRLADLPKAWQSPEATEHTMALRDMFAARLNSEAVSWE